MAWFLVSVQGALPSWRITSDFPADDLSDGARIYRFRWTNEKINPVRFNRSHSQIGLTRTEVFGTCVQLTADPACQGQRWITVSEGIHL